MTPENAPSPQPKTRQDFWYNLALGALVVLIIASLAMLWTRERHRRQNAEGDLMTLGQQYQQLKMAYAQMAVANLGGAEGRSVSIRPVVREDLMPTRGNLDGQTVPLYRITEATGKRMGFEPGDMIWVTPAPATQPQSQPASTQP